MRLLRDDNKTRKYSSRIEGDNNIPFPCQLNLKEKMDKREWNTREVLVSIYIYRERELEEVYIF